MLSERNVALNVTILSGDIGVSGSAVDNSLHIALASFTGGGTSLDGFIVRDAFCDIVDFTGVVGGGLFVSDGTVIVQNCTFLDNYADSAAGGGGGGIGVGLNSSAEIRSCSFEGNHADNGGAVYMRTGTLASFHDSSFRLNTADQVGGGVALEANNVSAYFDACVFSENESLINGGAVFNSTGTSVRMDRCSLNANSAAHGGAVYTHGSATFERCAFLGNDASVFGGAISAHQGAVATYANCTFLENSASDSGGAIATSGTNTSHSVLNSVFAGNSAVNRGGVVYEWAEAGTFFSNCAYGYHSAALGGVFRLEDAGGAPSATLRNCVVWSQNDAPVGPQISAQGGSVVSVQYSDVRGGHAGTGNINADPLFVDVDGDDNVLGTADDNLRLSLGSPCIDAGANALVFGDFADLDEDGALVEKSPLDLDDLARFQDDPLTSDTGSGTPPIVDMGAYEYRLPVKFSQPPDDAGEDIASNVDLVTFAVNSVVADDFVSDGRPITAVRWWGSDLADPKDCSTPFTCGGPAPAKCGGYTNCYCYKRPDGSGDCATGLCNSFGYCPNGDTDCPGDTKCFIDTCCGAPVCLMNCGTTSGVQAASAVASVGEQLEVTPWGGFIARDALDPEVPEEVHRAAFQRTDRGMNIPPEKNPHLFAQRRINGAEETAGVDNVAGAPGEGLYVFTDNFDAGPSSLWRNERGDWTTSGGVYHSQVPSNIPPTLSSLPFVVRDFTIDVDVFNVEGGDGGVYLRRDPSGRGVMLVLAAGSPPNVDVYFHTLVNDAPTGAFGIVTGVAAVGDDLHLRVVVGGDMFSAYLNGATTPTTTAILPGYTPGHVGLYDFPAQPNMAFDNFRLESAGTCLIDNGDFETGNFAGWTLAVSGSESNTVTSAASCFPGFYAGLISLPTGFTNMYQTITIPANATSAILKWTDTIPSLDFIDPTREFRVLLSDPAGTVVLRELFSTNPGDPIQFGCVNRVAEISDFIGQTVRVNFIKQGTVLGPSGTIMRVFLDDICIELGNPRIVSAPEGWFVSFHEPLDTGGAPEPPLGLYYCDAPVVSKAPTLLNACDTHAVKEYAANLQDCCLLQAEQDGRSGATPATQTAFLEEECFDYALDIQAVAGVRFFDFGGGCQGFVTNNVALGDFWGWHSTGMSCGSPQEPALSSSISYTATDWLHGPWSQVTAACSAPNMAFELLTTNAVTVTDCNANCVADACETASVLGVDNGPLVTHVGGGDGGADLSALQSNLGMTTLGFGHQQAGGNRIAEDFTVTDGSGWVIDHVELFAYQTGSTTTSTMTGATLRIWDGPPSDPGSMVVFGDTTTNRLISSDWSGMYRAGSATPLDATRPIMRNVVSAQVTLSPGAYWLDWAATGSLSSGPWAPPITILGQVTTGNGLQFSGGMWQPAVDGGTLTQQGFPFRILLNAVSDSDCQPNGIPDDCDVADCSGDPACGDCNSNSIPDGCDLAACAGDPACDDCNANSIPDGCDIAGGEPDGNGNGIPDACEAPPEVIPDPAGGKTRTLSFSAPAVAAATATPGQTAIRITMIDLENPVPPNNNPAGPCCPPGNFITFDTAANSVCAGGNDQGYRCPPSACPGSSCSAAVGCTEAAGANAQGSCARWVGPPLGYLESNDNAGLGNYRAARLQCRPYYHDWAAEPNGGLVHVVGAEVVPSSTYEVQVYAASCKGNEGSCLAVSNPVNMTTRRAGDITTPFQGAPPLTQPNAIDVTNAVNKFRNLAGSPPKVISQVQPNFPDPNSDINAIDIVTVVDNQRGFGYTYSGPCVCPSTVPCNTTACAGASACTGLYGAGATCIKTCSSGPRLGQPCNNNLNCGACIGGPPTGNGAAGIPCDANVDCASGTCQTGVCPTGATPGFCRDRCGRCN
jgi:predicted outer membrane repeat protein